MSIRSNDRLFHTLEPVYNPDSKVLILGSFPSVVSRREGFYYANHGNRFWPVLAKVFDQPIIDRRQFCLDHFIALWDVIGSCCITGSSDASIHDIVVNPIKKITEGLHIRMIFTTGRKADELFKKYIDVPIEHIALPSTSGANARMGIDDLVREYQKIKEYTE